MRCDKAYFIKRLERVVKLLDIVRENLLLILFSELCQCVMDEVVVLMVLSAEGQVVEIAGLAKHSGSLA